MEVDVKRNRIGLSMRLDDEPGQSSRPAGGGDRGGDRGSERGGQRSGGKGFGGGRREAEPAGAMAAAFAKLKR